MNRKELLQKAIQRVQELRVTIPGLNDVEAYLKGVMDMDNPKQEIMRWYRNSNQSLSEMINMLIKQGYFIDAIVPDDLSTNVLSATIIYH